jgi:hypothetical protein
VEARLVAPDARISGAEPDPHGAIVAGAIEIPLEALHPIVGILLDPCRDGLAQDAESPGGAASFSVNNSYLSVPGGVVFPEKRLSRVESCGDPKSMQVERGHGPGNPQ